MFQNLQARPADRLDLASWGRRGGLCAAAVALLISGRAEAATLYRSVQQTFIISDRYAVDQQTLLDPSIRTATDQGFDVVEGTAIYSGVQPLRWPGFDPALGKLQSVTVAIASEGTWNVGLSAAYLPGRPGGGLFYGEFYLQADLNGVAFAGAASHDPLVCQASTAAGPCANTDKQIVKLNHLASFDPQGFIGPTAGIDLGYSLSSSWTAYVIGAPVTGLLNQLDWAGTVEVTYGYAPVPEPRTWTLLLMGFAALGSVLRRQARRAIASGRVGATM